MAERSIIATVLGVPPLASVGVAVAFTALGVLIDVLRIGTVGIVFKVGYFTGCVLAVAWVRRRSLFTPIVQPPLLVAVIVPALVLLVGPPRSGSGMAETLLLVGAPLINAFPTMATTTAVVVGLGVGRILLQRNDDGPDLGRLTGDRRPSARREPAKGAASRSGANRDGGPARRPRTGTSSSGTSRASGSPTSGRTDAGDTGSRPRDAGGKGSGGAARALGELRDDDPGTGRRPVSERRGSGAARGAGRTSRSPRRS
jgi:hypothetical protein